MKMRLLGVLAVLVALSGCATIFSGPTADVAIRTTPGATFAVSDRAGNAVTNGLVGEDSLASMTLARSSGYFKPHVYKVALAKDGFQPAFVDIDPSINPWYFANIVLGGFLGMVIIDPLTGSMFNLSPVNSEKFLVPIN